MIKLPHYRYSLLFLTLAIVCAGGKARAQENPPDLGDLPIIVDRKQAAALVWTQSAPVYPPVAKVNYIQGQVQVEITVNSEGKVASAHVLDGNAMLAESALQATRGWIYHPLPTPSGPSGFITTVKLKFALTHRASELTARQAERDFLRQVKPPQMVQPPEDMHAEDVVHMRLLVNEQGQVVDMDVAPTGKAKFEAARETLRHWMFRPAHWGTLPIASYLDVDVPVATTSLARASATSDSH